jgi:phenylpyruvate tautomerase PptA (4-oxalocrotonate tautomerase family)
MPLVKIYAPKRSKSARALRKISDGVQEALVAHANVPPNSRFYLFIRLERDEIVADPSYGGVTRSKNLVVIEITLNAGRTVEVKKALYAGIASRLEGLGVRPDDVIISLIEVTKENWSFGGGRATYV